MAEEQIKDETMSAEAQPEVEQTEAEQPASEQPDGTSRRWLRVRRLLTKTDPVRRRTRI